MPQPTPHPLSWAHPLVEEWFAGRFGRPTEPQEEGWPHILAGESTLICAPTGSGKTLAAFLACIDRLVRKALAGELQERTEVLYVSPLKALSNDIQKNLETPLGEILQLAGQRGLLMPLIRTAVRTGDTPMPERRAMLKRPPHILVTTPESLYILLTAEKSRALLKDIETVIVDEIHAVADDKRGAHLAISLERLETLVTQARPRPVRIGLSATQKPIELVARFLAGNGRPSPAIVDIGHRRALDLAVEVPRSELGPVASNEMWEEVYDRIAQLARQHRSTLVFVNTRRLAERVAHHLSERLGEDAVRAHHGSLSRKLRLAAENKLKSGEVRLLVATASLELGIDIGTVDLVCQINSPRSVAQALQRIGRAGHWRGAVPKGRIFAMTRDELVECAALVRAIRRGELDRIQVPDCPLDILAQQIVAMCASDEWREEDLFGVVRRAYPYRDLPRAEFDAILEILSEGITARRGRYASYLHRDRVNHRVRGRRGSRLVAITNGGAIPETALYTVVAEPEGTAVGTVDEDFAVESLSGDIMLLGNSSWRIRRVESAAGRLRVEDAHGAAPNVPFWRGEAPARTAELSAQVAELREQISNLVPDVEAARLLETAAREKPGVAGAVAWLREECGLDDSGAEQAIQYILQGRAVLGAVPTQTTLVAERFFDEGGGMQLVIHAPLGGRINRAWGLALRKRFCRTFNFELQAAATEEGLNISLGEQHSFPLADVFHFLETESVGGVLEQAVLASPIFATRWRWDATRALALPRFRNGKKIPLPIQRMRADDLLAAVFPDVAACQENIVGDIRIPDHPLVREVMKDALTEAMDLEGLKRLLAGIRSGAIRCVAVDTPVPSQFSHEILNANPYAYLDDAPLEERRARAVSLRRALPETVLGEIGQLDPAAIAQVREEAWPDVREADELDDVLETLVALPQDFSPLGREPVGAAWADYFNSLVTARRAARAVHRDTAFWVAAGKAKTFLSLFPAARFESEIPEIESVAPSADDALLALVRGWLAHSGPLTAGALGQTVGLPASEIQSALLRLEAEGVILRGQFTGLGETEWCERHLLARIHRLTLGTLRKQIEPVTAAQFMRWLLRWQHLEPGTQVAGERGALEVVRQLQGFEAPANAWEPQILARRIAAYDPGTLDQLCLTGVVGWGRLSPHPATLDAVAPSDFEGPYPSSRAGVRRVVPTSVSPVTFFVREEADWMMSQQAASGDPARGLSHGARQVLEFLRLHGASFFADIVRGVGKLKSEVETALWELVTAALLTADGFDNLRALIDPKRRAGQGRERTARPRHSTGRWSLLFPGQTVDRTRAVEALCRVLLERYGVVFRELLARETLVPKWREVLIAFRRLEDRGEVRGGRFVDGFLGEQFALPLAVESLRAMRSIQPSGETVTLAAADPLNLIGIVLPGERLSATSGRLITLRDGVAVAEYRSLAATAAGF
jgi:ATP-dependent helicase Lhr and Lhr-like helicase